MSSFQAPAAARKARGQASVIGSKIMRSPSRYSRMRMPRGSLQSPTKRTAKLLPTRKTTVSSVSMVSRISHTDIRQERRNRRLPAGQGQWKGRKGRLYPDPGEDTCPYPAFTDLMKSPQRREKLYLGPLQPLSNDFEFRCFTFSH